MSWRQHQWLPATAAGRFCAVMMLRRHSATLWSLPHITVQWRSPCVTWRPLMFLCVMFMWPRQELADCRYKVWSTRHMIIDCDKLTVWQVDWHLTNKTECQNRWRDSHRAPLFLSCEGNATDCHLHVCNVLLHYNAFVFACMLIIKSHIYSTFAFCTIRALLIEYIKF